MGMRDDFVSLRNEMFDTFSEFVKTITIRKRGEYDPMIGETLDDTTTDYSAIVSNYEAWQIDGTRVQANDKRLLVKSLTPSDIDAGHHVELDSQQLVIVSVIDSGTDGIITELQVRGR